MATVVNVGDKANKPDRVCDRLTCTGCGACTAVCPVNCIEMATDAEGFFYPKIEASKCIGCKKCERVCPEGAIQVVNNVAVIDYSKCIGCGKCAETCTTGCIRLTDLKRKNPAETA